jgi:hypothetical protein
MNNLCADIGYNSLNKYKEQLCGDHIECINQEDGSSVIVLADGLGSGVKANILSTLTSKIISTMMAEGCDIDDCVFHNCSNSSWMFSKGIAYSLLPLSSGYKPVCRDIIQYDNRACNILRMEIMWNIQNSIEYDKKKYITQRYHYRRTIFS